MKSVVRALVISGVLAVAVPALAASDHVKLNWGSQLNPNAACNVTSAPVINVTQTVLNDADSGFGGYWAMDNLTRTIQVWDMGSGNYCASVQYNGQFQGIPGALTPMNPAGGGTLSGNESGPFAGGYTATFSGTLKSVTLWPTQGNVGTTDYKCDTSGNCPGAFSWTDQYFDGVTNFTQPWWGWIYHGGTNDDWVNAVSGSSGNIL